MSFFDHLKRTYWRIITPVFPYCRDLLLWLRILHHEERQKYPLGWLVAGRTREGLLEHLKKSGFDNHFIAWVDPGEVLGVRKLENFNFQYHLRLFRDGEIRGHYEWTPESHPFRHFYDIGMLPKFEDFYSFLGDWLVRERSDDSGKMTSQSAPAALRTGPRNG